MIQRIESQGFLFILDTETEWDGVGYPSQAQRVWQCHLSNEVELIAYETLGAELMADWAKADAERQEAEKKEADLKSSMIDSL
jgi:hypothetical protein